MPKVRAAVEERVAVLAPEQAPVQARAPQLAETPGSKAS
jgi:hypothetical protein